MAEKKKGGDTKKSKKGRTLSGVYILSGNTIERKNKSCPKCGPGMFLGKHTDRVVCGKCGYVEKVAKSPKSQ